MARKPKFKPKSFESTGSGSDVSANIYKSMMLSNAFKDLTKNQRLLYLYMKMQYYGVKTDKHPDKNPVCFYFNKHLWSDTYGLYKNSTSFYADRNALIEHGFIIQVESGRNTRTKAIYQFSDEWQYYDTETFKQRHNKK